jgi:hypothetical protein
MASPAVALIVLDTLGKIYAHSHGLSGWCRPCRRSFRVPMPGAHRGRGSRHWISTLSFADLKVRAACDEDSTPQRPQEKLR